MSILDSTKEIAELIKKIGNIDLYKKIVDLEGEIIDLSREKHKLELKLHEIEKLTAQEQSMEFRKPFVFKKDDEQPFCPRCWEVDRKAIHLTGPIDGQLGLIYCCAECEEAYYP